MPTGPCSKCNKEWGAWERPSEAWIRGYLHYNQDWETALCTECGRVAWCFECADLGWIEGIGGRRVECGCEISKMTPSHGYYDLKKAGEQCLEIAQAMRDDPVHGLERYLAGRDAGEYPPAGCPDDHGAADRNPAAPPTA